MTAAARGATAVVKPAFRRSHAIFEEILEREVADGVHLLPERAELVLQVIWECVLAGLRRAASRRARNEAAVEVMT